MKRGHQPRAVLRALVSVCLGAGLLAFAAAILLGRPEPAAFGLGLLLGSANGILLLRSSRSGLPVPMTSLGRLALLSLLALGAGFLLFPTAVWAVPLGVAGAQLALAATALREAVSS